MTKVDQLEDKVIFDPAKVKIVPDEMEIVEKNGEKYLKVTPANDWSTHIQIWELIETVDVTGYTNFEVSYYNDSAEGMQIVVNLKSYNEGELQFGSCGGLFSTDVVTTRGSISQEGNVTAIQLAVQETTSGEYTAVADQTVYIGKIVAVTN